MGDEVRHEGVSMPEVAALHEMMGWARYPRRLCDDFQMTYKLDVLFFFFFFSFLLVLLGRAQDLLEARADGSVPSANALTHKTD